MAIAIPVERKGKTDRLPCAVRWESTGWSSGDYQERCCWRQSGGRRCRGGKRRYSNGGSFESSGRQRQSPGSKSELLGCKNRHFKEQGEGSTTGIFSSDAGGGSIKPFLGRVKGFARSKWGDESVQWSEDEEYKCGSIEALPVWVRLPGMKAHLADSSILSLLCSRIGRPICTDGVTAQGSSYNYARVCVEVFAELELEETIEFQDPYGNSYVQHVEYEWKPPRCVNCLHFGHLKERCPEPSMEMMIDGLKEEERDRKNKFKFLDTVVFTEADDEYVEETPVPLQGEKDHHLLNAVEVNEGMDEDLCSIVQDTLAAVDKEQDRAKSVSSERRGGDDPKSKLTIAEEFQEYVSKSALKKARRKERKRTGGEDSINSDSRGSRESHEPVRNKEGKVKKRDKKRAGVKLQEDRWERAIESCCPNASWKGVCSEIVEGWARILLLWDEDVFQITQIVRNAYFLCCKVQYGESSFDACFIYASNLASSRASLWKDLERIINHGTGSWLCMGDFNGILNSDEKRNGRVVRDSDLEDLSKFVSNCELRDIDASGHFFTWSNNNSSPDQRIWCKLDRAMGNEAWFNSFGSASAVFLPPGISDHCPVIVSWGEESRKKSSFRYCNFWEDLEGYQDKVSQCWNSSWNCRNLFAFQAKLKSMKVMMKMQFVICTRGMEKRVEELRKELGEAQQLVEKSPGDQALIQKEQDLVKDFRKLKEHQSLFYQQRSKIQWLQEGDSNSKFYHSFLKGRRSKNNISLVKDADGCIHTDLRSIKSEFVNYFKTILAESKSCRPIESSVIQRGNVIADSQCRPLILEATDVEICFYRKNWNLIGKELCAAVRHCLKFNALPKGMNSAIIALIPKSKTASEPGDYRPIACCNVVYKVISGLLAERLKKVLPDIIDKAQGAFVKDRSIVGNVCLAQQIVSGSGRCSSITALKESLDSFLQCSGLAVNFDKSQLFLAGFSEDKKNWIERMALSSVSDLPVRYLGVPLTHKSISAYDCSIIIQRITGRLNCWSNRLLSRAGRRLLIISVLQAIVFYWAQICILPKKVLKAINSICANFLWSGKSTRKGCHLLDWNSVCSEKKEGGLGIKNLDIMNDAMVMNQLWELNKNNLNVWSEWIKAYWTKGTHWWENDSLIQSSWVLRRLAYCKKLSAKCTEVSDGRLVWIGEGEGFTVQDTYRTLITRRDEVDWHKLAWNRFNTPRASLNAVLVARDRILTKSRMRNMTMSVDPICVLCKVDEETRDHLFFHCSTSRDVLGKVINVLGIQNMPTQWHRLIPWFKMLKQDRVRTRMIAAAITGTMYEIWCARNNTIFRGCSTDPDTISRRIIWGLKIKIGRLYINISKLQIHDRNWLNRLIWS
ncbi:hypothetical protein QQ045_028141 [Rhodiola kirilowii]